MANSGAKIKWLDDSETHNYPAALSYLTLILSPGKAGDIVARLRAAKVSEFKAKDIFRASALSLLGVSNSHVDRDKSKIVKGEPLSPILLVRDPAHGKVIIADGYHRLCALYSFDEDASVRCKICDC
ncbi:MAG: hypothetical protein ACHQ4G_07440 [Opitutales bacterium]